MSTNPAAAGTSPWYTIWSGREISFQRVFEQGGTNLFNSSGKPGKVRLKPVFAKDRSGAKTLVRFKVKCKSWEAEPALNGLILSPMGNTINHLKPTLPQPLPKWIDENATGQIYGTALKPFVDVLHKPADPMLQRLEGLYSVPAPQGINIDRVRVLFFESAIADGSDLALVVFTLLEGAGGNQNGGGSGPPH